MQVVCAAKKQARFYAQEMVVITEEWRIMKEPFALFIWVTSSSVSGVSENVTV